MMTQRQFGTTLGIAAAKTRSVVISACRPVGRLTSTLGLGLVDCAVDERYEFMFAAPALTITGAAVGSPVDPRAIKSNREGRHERN